MHAGNVEVHSIEITVSDLVDARRFFTRVLQFDSLGDSSGTRHTATLRLGEETLVLVEPDSEVHRIPGSMPSNDQRFQHIAIVVSDMDAAYRKLLAAHVDIVSEQPQTLPRWNYDAADIRALYFRDPDGHFLELIQFPAAKGEPKWHRRDGSLFLGIDHTAIVVRDMRASRDFYRDTLGLTVIGTSLNYGAEQDRLNRLPGSRVQITSLRGAKGPGIELLHYERPRTVGMNAGGLMDDDLLHWQINLRAARTPAWGIHTTGVDPDGHALGFESLPAVRMQWDHLSEALRQHYSRYLMEGAQLAIFMIVTLYLTLLLEHPLSPVRRAIASGPARRVLMGLCIGLTVAVLIYSDWGRQSGAHFNPAVTLAFASLDRIEPWDAFFYVVSQFIGGALGLALATWPVRQAAAHKTVNYVVTQPGPRGACLAFVAESIISFAIFFSLLSASREPAWKSWTGIVAGLHLWAFITFEAPWSGMSLNPARSLASAIHARSSRDLWIYFVAPPLAMLLAAFLCRWWLDS